MADKNKPAAEGKKATFPQRTIEKLECSWPLGITPTNAAPVSENADG